MTELPFVGQFLARAAYASLVGAAFLMHSNLALSQPDPVAALPRLESVLGREVTAPKGVEGGRVIDVLIDSEGSVQAFVVEFGGFLGIGTRKIAVERAAFRFAGPKILVEVSGERLRNAREYAAGEPPYVVKADALPRD